MFVIFCNMPISKVTVLMSIGNPLPQWLLHWYYLRLHGHLFQPMKVLSYTWLEDRSSENVPYLLNNGNHVF